MRIINPFGIVLIGMALCSGPVCAGADELYPRLRHITGDWGGYRTTLHEAGGEVGRTYTAEPSHLARYARFSNNQENHNLQDIT